MWPVGGVRAEFSPFSMTAGLVFNAFAEVCLNHSLLLPLNNGGSSGVEEVFLFETVGVPFMQPMISGATEVTAWRFGTLTAFRSGRTGMEEVGGCWSFCSG